MAKAVVEDLRDRASMCRMGEGWVMLSVIEVSTGNFDGPVGAFATGSEIKELHGVAEYMLLPIAICVLISWVGLGFWKCDLQRNSRLALSIAIGPLITTTGYVLFWTAHHALQNDEYSVSVILNIPVLLFLFGILLYPPTLIILGPIVAVCLLNLRHGQRLSISNLVLYVASAIAVVLEYSWLRFVLSG
jgi:hypothetical protein